MPKTYTETEKIEIQKQFADNWIEQDEIEVYRKTGKISRIGTNKDMSQYIRTEKQIEEKKKEIEKKISE